MTNTNVMPKCLLFLDFPKVRYFSSLVLAESIEKLDGYRESD